MNTLPFSFAQRHGVLLAPGPDGELIALVRAGAGLAGLAEAGRVVRRSLRPKLIGAEEFDLRLRARYESGADSALSIAEDLDEDTELGVLARELPAPSDLLDSENDAPIIRLLNAVLASAIRTGASDVHLEPGEFNLSVRFRVDGALRETLKLRRGLSPLVISRAKVMADLDIAEKRLPQDGRISLRIAGRAVDVRVSTLPGIHGERVVLRLLDKQSGRLDLESLGMDTGTLRRMERLIRRPHGIVLVTGPTGSGKTTTLYAALDRINDSTRNIMTVEDPVEYYLDGIGQTQVNARVGLTFARGLRAILRQDPDVVMVGEIPRPGDGGNRRARQPHGSPCILHPAHQHRGGSGDTVARHGTGALSDFLQPAGHPGAATGAPTRYRNARGVLARRVRMRAAGNQSARGAHALPAGIGRHGRWRRVSRPHRHL